MTFFRRQAVFCVGVDTGCHRVVRTVAFLLEVNKSPQQKYNQAGPLQMVPRFESPDETSIM